jgi:hypothetical protein
VLFVFFGLCILLGCRLALMGFTQGRWFIAACGLVIAASCFVLAVRRLD